MRRMEVPFCPPEGGLKMELRSGDTTCYLFDSCCRDFSPEEKARTDRAVLSIYYEAAKADMTGGRAGLPGSEGTLPGAPQ